jgi:ribosomal protein S18 acetylase RimI-like enzyme
MVTIRMVDTHVHAPRLFLLFDENDRDATHPRAVVAEGAAQLWLAEAEGRLVGALVGRPLLSSDGERRGGVDNLLVDARHQRRGIGRRLLQEAEAYYRSQGLSGMELSLNAENTTAHLLYDSMGYEVVARYTRRRRDAAGEERLEPRLRMRKPFEGSRQAGATESFGLWYPPRTMTRLTIEVIARRLEAAYRGDPFHALRTNLESVTAEEWEVRPAGWSPEVFGTDPELSIGDLVLHTGGAKYMYAARLSGNTSLDWADIAGPPSRDKMAMMAWLDEGHRALEEALQALADDSELAVERLAPWRRPMRTEHLIGIVINHDLYHAGEINRQRALLRGAEGWDRGG